MPEDITDERMQFFVKMNTFACYGQFFWMFSQITVFFFDTSWRATLFYTIPIIFLLVMGIISFYGYHRRKKEILKET